MILFKELRRYAKNLTNLPTFAKNNWFYGMDNFSVLKRFLPENSAQEIAGWIDKYDCDFTISKSRQSKLGDYRAPTKLTKHKISVNHNLNPYAFLITTVHEFAHLVTWNSYKGRVSPHGAEWKNTFNSLMKVFFDKNIFPYELKNALVLYMQNPAASSCSDQNLIRELKKYDLKKHIEGCVFLEDIPMGALFKIKDGRVFRKIEKLRKRYKCELVGTKKMYLVSAIAEVSLSA